MSKYYAVRKGKKEGIFETWSECSSYVAGFRGAKFKSFYSLNDAEKYMSNERLSNEKIILSPDNCNFYSNVQCLFVDGGHNKHTGNVALASVVDDNYVDKVEEFKLLFNDMKLVTVNLPVGIRTLAVADFSDVKKQQNNGAELLAMIMGLRIALHTNSYNIIYSDSQLMIDYWSKGRVKYNPIMDSSKINYIKELKQLRDRFNGKIIKISGDVNKADLGYHK